MEKDSQFVNQLYNQWNNIYKSEKATYVFTSNFKDKVITKNKDFYLYYNQDLKHKRTKSTSIQQVFAPFNPDLWNFNKCSDKQILFYLDLENQEIITKDKVTHHQQQAQLTTAKFMNQDESQAVGNQGHMVVLNTAPFCLGHSIICLFPDQQLPQVVGSDIILHLTNIFGMIGNNTSFKIGYNSLGGSATVNHLHFHLLQSQQLINQKILPVQKAKLKLIKRTSLIDPKQEINMCNKGVDISELQNYPLNAFVLTPNQKDKDIEDVQIFRSLAYVFGIIINCLLQSDIPHNVVMVENGTKILIFPRKHQFENKYNMNIGWLQASGVMICNDVKLLDELSKNLMQEILLNHRVEKQFNIIKQKLINILSKYQ